MQGTTTLSFCYLVQSPSEEEDFRSEVSSCNVYLMNKTAKKSKTIAVDFCD